MHHDIVHAKQRLSLKDAVSVYSFYPDLIIIPGDAALSAGSKPVHGSGRHDLHRLQDAGQMLHSALDA